MTHTCIICRSKFDPANNKEEHILLNALGGKRKTKEATCSTCNGDAGITIDEDLADAVSLIRNFFDFRSGSRADAPKKTVKTTTGEQIDLLPGGGLDDRKAAVNFNKEQDKVSFNGGITGYERIAERIPHMAKQAGVSEEKLRDALLKDGLAVHVKPAPVITGTIDLARYKTMASVAKMGLILWNERVGNVELTKSCYDSIASKLHSYIKNQKMPPEESWHFDARIPDGILLPNGKAWSEFYNFLHVYCDGQGTVRCWFRLYNSFNYYIDLGVDSSHVGSSITLTSNPETLETEIHLNKDSGLSDEWLRSHSLDQKDVEQAVGRLIEVSQERRRITHRDKLIEEAIAESFPGEGEIIEEHHVTELSRRVAEALVGDMLGIGHHKVIPTDKAKELLENLSKRKK